MNYTKYPSWISPDVIPPSVIDILPKWLSWLSFLKWYGMMYIVATLIIYALTLYQIKQEKMTIPSRSIEDFFTWGLIGMFLGARLLATLVWDNTWLYLTHPWMIFLPINQNWTFIGFQGMAFHGGLVGLALGCWIYTRKNKYSFFQWIDWICSAFPLGYTFGRLGNFFNAELYGRPVEGGMLFPNAKPYSLGDPGVLEFAQKIGMELVTKKISINLPRHPSQLYEAFGEGILLFLFLWFIIRPRKSFTGEVTAWFLVGYGIIRFFIEYFRDTTDELGFVLQFQSIDLFKIAPLNLSLGQIFCFIMIVTGAALWKIRKNLSKHS